MINRKMLHIIPELLHAEVSKLTPCSVWSKCASCVIYDGHPRDEKKIDITICSELGEVQEFYQRELVASLQITGGSGFKEIIILRNKQGELFYVVSAKKEIVVISSKDKLCIHLRIPHVLSYEVCDPQCTGEAKLKVVTNTSSEIYLSIADNFEQIDIKVPPRSEDVKPVISDLKTKLNEAKYNLQCKEIIYEQILNLRQWITYSKQETEGNQMDTPKPCIRFCNKKIVIQLQLHNPFNESMEKVSILIHNNSCKSISYTSKLYKELTTCPFFEKIENQELTPEIRCSVAVAVIPFTEFKNSINSRIDFNVVVSYQRQGRACLQSFGSVNMSASDVMGKNFDVFNNSERPMSSSGPKKADGWNNSETDDLSLILAVLSTTDKTTLCLKQVFEPSQEVSRVSVKKIFCNYIGMEMLKSVHNVAVHRQSPHHILHGLMITFDKLFVEDKMEPAFSYTMNIYSRSPSQVLALLHFIYDKVEHTMIVTTVPPAIGKTPCVSSLLEQASMTLKYLDNCLEEMNKSKSVDIQKKSSLEIDIFAMGFEKFEEYRNAMLAALKLELVEDVILAQDIDSEFMDTD